MRKKLSPYGATFVLTGRTPPIAKVLPYFDTLEKEIGLKPE